VADKKQKLEAEIVKMSRKHPTLGYKKVARKLQEHGWAVNKKQVQRVRREEGLQVPPPRRRQRRRGRSTGLPQQAAHRNHVWAWDFVSDNGPEFIAKAIQGWLRDNNIKTIYIDPGCPWQNGYAESFNGRFRAECLNRELLYTLSESRVVFEDWRRYYNS